MVYREISHKCYLETIIRRSCSTKAVKIILTSFHLKLMRLFI